jgi:hypothetical protein
LNSQATTSVASPRSAVDWRRLRPLVFPREHGAWGMLLVPVLTGGALGLRTGSGVGPLALLLVASLALFCLRTPVEALLGASPFRVRTRDERDAVLLAIGGYGVLALVCLAALLRAGDFVLPALGAAAAAGFAGQYLVRRVRPRARCSAQLVGSAGLTAAAAAAYYVAAGRWSSTALLVWGANWLFAANQIHYVQLRIHVANAAGRLDKIHRGLHFLFGEIVLTSVLVAAAQVGAFPWAVSRAYLPVLARGLAWFLEPPRPLAIHRLGYSELAHACVFAVLLVVAW